MVFQEAAKVDSADEIRTEHGKHHIVGALGQQGAWYVVMTDNSYELGEGELEEKLDDAGYTVSAVYRGDRIKENHPEAYDAAEEARGYSVENPKSLFLVKY